MVLNKYTAKKTAELLLQINAIKLNSKNPFIWASGWISPIYCDNRIILSHPKIRIFIRDMDDSNFSVHIYNDISIEKGILNFASETNANLIGMGTHGRRGLAHFFNGSVSEDLVNHANMPVMTFKI